MGNKESPPFHGTLQDKTPVERVLANGRHIKKAIADNYKRRQKGIEKGQVIIDMIERPQYRYRAGGDSWDNSTPFPYDTEYPTTVFTKNGGAAPSSKTGQKAPPLEITHTALGDLPSEVGFASVQHKEDIFESLLEEFAGFYTDEDTITIKKVIKHEMGLDLLFSEESTKDLDVKIYSLSEKKVGPSLLMNFTHLQRGRFAAELYGLTTFLKTADQKATIVYVGSAPGIHIPFLAALFPNTTWHLYDMEPVRFIRCNFGSKCPQAVLDRITIYEQEFTDGLAHSWKEKADIVVTDILLSIIDKFNTTNPAIKEARDTIRALHSNQENNITANWIKIIKPRFGSLQNAHTSGLNGALTHGVTSVQALPLKGKWMYPVWNTHFSHSLIVISTLDDILTSDDGSNKPFDWQRINDINYYRRAVLRPWATFKALPGFEKVPGFDRCLDCASEARIWALYDELDGKPDDSSPPERMSKLTESLGLPLICKCDKEAGPPYHGNFASLPTMERLQKIAAASGWPQYRYRQWFTSWDGMSPSPFDTSRAVVSVEDIEASQRNVQIVNTNAFRLPPIELVKKVLNMFPAGTYTPIETEAISHVASLLFPEAKPIYNSQEETYGVVYRPKKLPSATYFMTLHHGQRKLFVGELQFLTRVTKYAKDPSRELVIVYAGAAPGQHLPYLAELFPQMVFHLYDPAPFKFAKQNAVKLHTYNEYFTDDIAKQWADTADAFICDIRVGIDTGEAAWSQEFEDQVAADMAAQERWTYLMRPTFGAMLKFRPPYVNAGEDLAIKYIDGYVLWQTWPPKFSTEGRLVVPPDFWKNKETNKENKEVGINSLESLRKPFDVAQYQDACAYHNMVVRPWAIYAFPAPNMEKVPGYDRCFDCTNEANAWIEYDFMQSHPTNDIPSYMNRLSKETHQRLDAQKNEPPFHGIAANEPPLSRFMRIAELRVAAQTNKYFPRKKKYGGSNLPGSSGLSKPTFAIISGEIPTEEREAIVAAFNSPGNTHGAIIKAILVSKTGAEGLDLKFIRETHQVEPYWDRSRDDQVRARAVRLGSHDLLPRDERVVQSYVYISTYNTKVRSSIRSVDQEVETVDELFARRSAERSELCNSFRSLLASVCFECVAFGYSDKCRTCMPTNAKLFSRSFTSDLKKTDPCVRREERNVSATPVTVNGTVYYYVKDADDYKFYEWREDLGGYSIVDSATLIDKIQSVITGTAIRDEVGDMGKTEQTEQTEQSVTTYTKSIKQPWFSLIKQGRKLVEGRLNKGVFANIKKDDSIIWTNRDEKCQTNVTYVKRYTDFKEMLEAETIERALPEPTIKTIEDGVDLYHQYFSTEDEKKYGVVAVGLSISFI